MLTTHHEYGAAERTWRFNCTQRGVGFRAAPMPLPLHGYEQEILERLWEEYRIEVPLVRWGGRDFVRLSIQAYNSPDDVLKLENALRTLLN